jgi:hypothetical protein
MRSLPSPLDCWISNGNTDVNKPDNHETFEVAGQNENPRWQTFILSEMYESCGVSHKILQLNE